LGGLAGLDFLHALFVISFIEVLNCQNDCCYTNNKNRGFNLLWVQIMQRIRFIVLVPSLLFAVLIFTIFLSQSFPFSAHAEAVPDVYVGIDKACAGDPKILIDKVNSYTNLIIFGAGADDQLCQYAYDKGMYFVNYGNCVPSKEWLENAKNKWGSHLLGFYYNDEIGGRQLDIAEGNGIFDAGYFEGQKPTDYADAADKFIEVYNMMLDKEYFNLTGSTYYPFFSSDYALYWFDYKAGYDVLLSQFVWDYSRQQNIAFIRGAATVQNKEWGIITVWKYDNPPYIESGEELYADLVLAYNNGAKYITVFDANIDYTQSILKEEHYQALEQFWQYIKDNPRNPAQNDDRVAFVLPKGYAYGFRGFTDKIWGIWQADAFSYNMSLIVNHLLEEYGERLDIIYDDGLTASNTAMYSRLIYWDTYTPSPEISILSPENKTYTTNNVTLEYTIDSTVTWAGYSLDNQANVTLAENTTLTGLSNGYHTLIIYAKDEFNNTGVSSETCFTVDTDIPEFPSWIILPLFLIATLLAIIFRKRYFVKSQEK